MKKPTTKILSTYIILLLIIVLFGAILRFVNTPDRYLFDGDSIRDALVVVEGARTLSFPLTGPFSSTAPYTFGPWYYIGLIIPMILLPFPYIPWIALGIVSLITILLMADIGRLLSGKKLGIILAVLTAIAPTQINTALGLSNINPVIFFATLSLWIAFKLTKKEFTHPLWYVGLGLALGGGINAHYQMSGLLLLPLLVWLHAGWKKIMIPVLIGFGLCITFIPLLIFNVLHHWHTINGFNEMLIAKERIYVPNSWRIYLFSFWVEHLKFILFTSPVVNIALLVSFVVAVGHDFLKKRLSGEMMILFIIFAINFIWLRFYWGERHDVYLYYLSPLLFIFLGYTLVSFFKLRFGIVLFTLFSVLIGWHMLSTDFTRIAESSRAQAIPWKKEVQMLVTRYPDTKIVLYSCNSLYESHKRTLVYLLHFENKQSVKEKKIGVIEGECRYPETDELHTLRQTLIEKPEEKIYPPLFPELKDINFNFIDLSSASPNAIKEAGWEEITTTSVFQSSVDWWKK